MSDWSSDLCSSDLLLSYAQTERPNRDWWLNILDLYGASAVLVAEARLDRAYPGGAVIGRFTARHGPDGLVIKRFELRTNAAAGPAPLLVAASRRDDAAYVERLRDGPWRPEPPVKFNDLTRIALSAPIPPGM